MSDKKFKIRIDMKCLRGQNRSLRLKAKLKNRKLGTRLEVHLLRRNSRGEMVAVGEVTLISSKRTCSKIGMLATTTNVKRL